MNLPCKQGADGISLPILGQGTWRMGGGETRDWNYPDAEAVEAIRRGIKAGLRHIDTAEMYADGHAEELVAEAICGEERSTLFITDKVWKTHLHYEDVLRAAEASLKRLKTDYLDLYLIHQIDPTVPIAETIRAMNRLRSEKIIRHMGVSNFSVLRMQEALAAADYPLAANQIHYNLHIRGAEADGVLKFCRERDIPVIAWRPLRDVDLTLAPIPELALKYRKTPAQIALNWLIQQPGVCTITRAMSPKHLAENCGALGWCLAAEDLERIRREYPALNHSPVVPFL